MTDEPGRIEIKSEQLNNAQNGLVVLHLWNALRQAIVRMNDLNGAQVVADFQRTLIDGAKNGEVTGLPMDQEKAVVDFVVKMFEGLVTIKRD